MTRDRTEHRVGPPNAPIITGEMLERAETRLRAAYSSEANHFNATERIVDQIHGDRDEIDRYVMAHVDKLDKVLKACTSQAEARRVLATMVIHYLAVGSIGTRMSEGKSW